MQSTKHSHLLTLYVDLTHEVTITTQTCGKLYCLATNIEIIGIWNEPSPHDSSVVSNNAEMQRRLGMH